MRCAQEVVGLSEDRRIELEFDEERHERLMSEAERLGLPAEEIARRALAAWLNEMADDNFYPAQAN